jgi:flagellar protein FliL
MAEEDIVEEKKKSGMLKWIILVVLLLALGGGGYFAYLKFFAAPPAETPAVEEGAAPAEGGAPAETPAAEAPAEGEGGHGGGEGAANPQEGLVSIPTFVVNLADAGGRRYLKVTIDVEVKGAGAVADVEKNMSKIRDAILLLLSSKQKDELSTMEGKISLRREIAERINQSLGGEPKVARVYFTEFVIQ